MSTDAPPSAEEVYDDIGSRYEIAFQGLSPQQASISWLLDELKNNVPSKIVDIGCGTGRPPCEAFAKAGHDVLGVDLSTAMIEAAKANVPAAKFEKADMREFLASASPSSYDAVTVYFSTLAGLTQDEIRGCIMKISQILKPGGRFVFATVPLSANEAHVTWMGRQVVVSSLDPETILSFLPTCGFEVVQHELSKFKPRGDAAGLCTSEESWEETHIFVYARKKESE